jgi:succinyl-CoA:acetate CoA-transferase
MKTKGETMQLERIRCEKLRSRVTTAEDAVRLIRDGMTVGMSGFGYAGDCKRVPFALAERAAREPMRVTLITSASLGHDIDKTLAEANVTARRMPYHSDAALRKKTNGGAVMYIDQHLSEMVEQLRAKFMGPMDVAVIEATAITECGGIVPTTSVGASADFAAMAKRVIVEINLNMPAALEGLHDVYVPIDRPYRLPVPLIAPAQRVGLPFIQSIRKRLRRSSLHKSTIARHACAPPTSRHRILLATSTNFSFMRFMPVVSRHHYSHYKLA